MSKYDNLSQKSIFDFCDDPRVLSFITSIPSAVEYRKEVDEEARLFDLHMLAFILGDDHLSTQVYNTMPVVIDWGIEVHAFVKALREDRA